jgi:septal ring factor EnvC (AmiA/AmiB activator)
MLRLIVAMGALLTGLSVLLAAQAGEARAADVAGLKARVDRAHTEARQLAGTVELRNKQFQAAAASAAAAGREQALLEAELATGRARVKRLRADVTVAKGKFRRAQERLHRAQDQLAERLVSIYKSDRPDLATVVLDSNGFEDMLTRATYLKKINQTDTALVDEVKALRNQVRTALKRVKTLKAQADAEVDRLAAARAQIAQVRQQAQARAAEAESARAAAQSSLDTLHSRISQWTSEVEALQAATGQGGNAGDTVNQWFDGFTIPKYIVMCESGGNYKAVNPGSGAGGAYQFMPETYKGLGGKYDSPQDAPKWEQDKLAAKLWNNGAGAGNWECAQ